MRPSFPNQNQADRSNNAVHQQVLLTNHSTPNVGAPSPCLSYGHNSSSMNSQSLVHVSLSPFIGAFAQLGAFNGNGTALPDPHFMQVANYHLPMPNSHLCPPPMVSSSPQNLNKPRGQVYQQNTLQNINSIAGTQQHGVLHNFPQNFNQTMAAVPCAHLLAHGSPQVTIQQRPLQPHGSASIRGGQCGSLNQPMNRFSNFPVGPLFQQPIGPQFGGFNLPPLVGCLNQNPPFPLNPQSSTVNSNQVVQQNIISQQMFMPRAIGQNVVQDLPISDPNIQMNALASVNSGPVQKQEAENNSEPPPPIHGPQVYQPRNKINISNFNQRNHQNKFSNSHRGNEKKKFQKSNPHHLASAKGNFRHFGGKGDRVRKSQVDHSAELGEVKNRRSVSLNYSEQEIQQWRDERKKNYPSKSNIEKKLTQKIAQPGEVDNDGQRRRQELREILAKQAELGVEVAELPPNYLSDSNDQLFKKTEEGMCSDNSRFQNKKGRFQNKYGKRQKHGKVNGSVKKQKFGDNGTSIHHSLNKKKPTLLQKLLTADIKRDKIHLLQAFRFMVMNSFFKHWPEKPLEFPQVTVEDDVSCKVESTEEKPSECRGRGDTSEIGEPPVFEACEVLKDHGATINDDEDSASEDVVYGDTGEIDSLKDEMYDSGGEEGEITD